MRVVCDIEANGLVNPTKIWVIVAKDLDSGDLHIFRKVSDDDKEKARFIEFSAQVTCWIGHGFLGYDFPVLRSLIPACKLEADAVVDTLILSRLINYSRKGGHSIEQYGLEFNSPKGKFSDFSHYSLEMENYCVQDVEIGCGVYGLYRDRTVAPEWIRSIQVEHQFQLVVNSLTHHGFGFDTAGAKQLLGEVEVGLAKLDAEIKTAFPPKLKLVKEIIPKVTKHGTLSKNDFRWVKDGDLAEYNGGPFSRCEWVEFNPDSAKQRIDVLRQAGWQPIEKTKTHIEVERELNHAKYNRYPSKEFDLRLEELHNKLQSLQIYGWKCSEDNLATLPQDAPPSARALAQRILLESRRRTLTEWLDLVRADGRIHGKFFGIGAWTHRMAHQNPNTANIPTGNKLYAQRMRALWCAAKNRLLVGVDADSIQFRMAAHYINDPALIKKIVDGKKSDGTDPHSYNKRVIGDFCKSRDASKRTLFSLILGGGIPKLAQILEASKQEAEIARDNLYAEYPGLVLLKNEIVVEDAKRGYFIGLDGRQVPIPSDTFSGRKHLCPSGYLQCGEAVVMKHATIKWHERLKKDKELLDIIWFLVNLVHDEFQTEGPNNIRLMLKIAQAQADAIREVGEDLGCRCPLAGSIRNDHDYTIGTNWAQTH